MKRKTDKKGRPRLMEALLLLPLLDIKLDLPGDSGDDQFDWIKEMMDETGLSPKELEQFLVQTAKIDEDDPRFWDNPILWLKNQLRLK